MSITEYLSGLWVGASHAMMMQNVMCNLSVVMKGCPNQEGGVSGSGGVPASSVSADAALDEPDDDQDSDASEVSAIERSADKTTDVPPEHYLTHMPKHPKCEVCQSAKMQNRQCRSRDKAITHSAKTQDR